MEPTHRVSLFGAGGIDWVLQIYTGCEEGVSIRDETLGKGSDVG